MELQAIEKESNVKVLDINGLKFAVDTSTIKAEKRVFYKTVWYLF